MTEKIGSLIIDLEGTYLSQEEKELLTHPLVGGIILFSRNYESRNQLKDLCQQIRNISNKPCLIMVDQEGGRVQRFIPEFTRLPYLAELGKRYDDNPQLARGIAEDCGWVMAIELLSAGLDLSLAPVLDLNKGVSSVIGCRAFHSDAKVVIDLACSFISGMQQAGMAATGKHFPGHGSITFDSHVAKTVDERSLKEIMADDLVTFSGLIKANIPAIMTAHIVYPKIDSLAVSFSPYWLKEILRNQLGFKGVLLSDDLNMEGANISSNYSDRVKAAREAGCDFALLCNNRNGVIQVLDQLPYASHLITEDKWKNLQGKFKLVDQYGFEKNTRWQVVHDVITRLTNANS